MQYSLFVVVISCFGASLVCSDCVLCCEAGTVDSQSDHHASRIEHMEFAGPLYGLLRKYNDSMTLADIDQKIGFEMVQTEKGSEIEVMRRVANSYQVRMKYYRLDPAVPSKVPIPCLLIVSRTGKIGMDGVFVLVEAIGSDSFQVYDFRPGKGRGFLSFRDLDLVWAGDVVTVATSPITKIGWVLLLLVLLFVPIVAYQLRKKLTANSTGRSVIGLHIFVAVLVTFGCNSSLEQSKINPVVPESGNWLILGEVGSRSDEPVAFTVPVRVNPDFPIRVSRLLGDCSCLLFEDEFKGRLYHPDEIIELRGKLDLSGKVGEEVQIIELIVEGETGEPLPSLKTGIRYFVKPEAVPSAERVKLSGVSTAKELTGTLNIYLVRRQYHPKLVLAEQTFLENDVQISVVDSGEAIPFDSYGEVVRDVVKLELTLPHDKSDQFKTVSIHFDGYRSINVDIETQWLSTFEATPDRFFLGILNKNQNVVKSFAVKRRPMLEAGDWSPVIQVRGNSIEVTKIAEISDQEVHVDFQVAIGEIPGRVEESLLIQLGNDQVEVPISWVVK